MALIGKAASVLALKATLNITTKPGASVTITKGGVTVATLTANSSGNCSLEILAANFGTYTASARHGYATGSASINVADVTTYNLTVHMTLYFIQNGNFVNSVGHNFVGDDAGYFRDMGDYIELSTYQGGSWAYAAGYITPAISFDGYWKNLIIDSNQIGNGAWVGVAPNNTAQDISFTKSAKICENNRSSYTGRKTSTCAVTGFTGSRYVALQSHAWIQYSGSDVIGSAGIIRCYNLYLRSY